MTFTVPANQLQTGVSAGLVHDGLVIPTTLEPVVAASNTSEAMHAYSVVTMATLHVVAGVAQPLVATASLPDTSWTPANPNAPVVFSEQSLKVVQAIAIPPVGLITTTSACTPNSPATIATLDGLPKTVTGTMSDTNTCTSKFVPALMSPTTTTVAVVIGTSASPNPPNGNLFTLSRGKLTMSIPATAIQTAVDAGLLRNGDVLPTTVDLALAASNTTESTRSYTLDAPIHVSVVGGRVQTLTTTVSLADTVWHPVNGAAPVVVTEQSLGAVLTLNLAGTVVKNVLACAPSVASPIVTLAGGVPAIVPGTGAVAEGNAGTTNLEVPVALTFASSSPVSAHWSTEFLFQGAEVDEAQADVDYTPASGVVTFAPGITTATVTVPVHGDTIPEADEYVVVAFGSPVAATIGGFYGLGFGTITNDDFAVVGPGGGSIAEGQSGASSLDVSVTLSKPATVPVAVPWNTVFIDGASGIQATPGVDYTAASGTVTFAPGETTKTVTISVNGDHEVEPDEWIVVSFHTPTGPARIGGYYGLGFGVIVNDD